MNHQGTLWDVPEPTAPGKYLESGANISDDGKYRYRLWRVWNTESYTVTWVLLNPSTADADTDDPTLTRCVNLARSWHAGSIVVVNLFAARATDPRGLRTMEDPIGPENDHCIRLGCLVPGMCEVVVGWGADRMTQHQHRATRVLSAIKSYRRGVVYCLGTTKTGAPRHPLYLPRNVAK